MTIAVEITHLESQLAASTGLKERAGIILNIIKFKSSIGDTSGNSEYVDKLLQLGNNLEDDNYRGWAFYYKGRAKNIQTDYSADLEALNKARHFFERVNNIPALAETHRSIGIIYFNKGDYPNALSHYKHSLAFSEQMDDKALVAQMNGNIGLTYYSESNYTVAMEYIEKALAHDTATGNQRGVAHSYMIIGNIYYQQGNYAQALEYQLNSVKIREGLNDKLMLQYNFNNLALIYLGQENYPTALEYFNKSLRINEEISGKRGMADNYHNIGATYLRQGKFREAFEPTMKAYKMNLEIGEKRRIAFSMVNLIELNSKLENYAEAIEFSENSIALTNELGIKDYEICALRFTGEMFTALGDFQKADSFLIKALALSKEIGHREYKKETLFAAYRLEKMRGDGMAALDYHEQFVGVEKELNNEETSKKIASLQFGYHIEKKEQEITFERAKKEALQVAYDLLGQEKARSERLLLNILPGEVAEELKEKGTADAKHFDNVTVLFTDFKGFTTASEKLSPQQLVDELHACFSAFDEICGKYKIEKIKTVGDAYLAVSGLPLANPNHAGDLVNAAIEIRDFMSNRKSQITNSQIETFEVRIGIHSGSVVAGIVGVKKFAYDIWGDTVNTAARMEQNSEAGKINISQSTYELVKNKFNCEYRGEIEAKNKGKLKMYFVV